MHHKKHIRLLLSLMGSTILPFAIHAMRDHDTWMRDHDTWWKELMRELKAREYAYLKAKLDAKIKLVDAEGKEMGIVDNLDRTTSQDCPFNSDHVLEFTLGTVPEQSTTFFISAWRWYRNCALNLDQWQQWEMLRKYPRSEFPLDTPVIIRELPVSKLREFKKTETRRVFQLVQEIDISTEEVRALVLPPNYGSYLIVAAEEGNLESIQRFFELADPTSREQALAAAVTSERRSVAKWLKKMMAKRIGRPKDH